MPGLAEHMLNHDTLTLCLRPGQVSSSATHFRGFVQSLLTFPLPMWRVASRLGGRTLALQSTITAVILGIVFIALHLAELGVRLHNVHNQALTSSACQT